MSIEMAIQIDQQERDDFHNFEVPKISWNPVNLIPEYSYEVDQGGPYQTLATDKIRKHLLYLGWKIESRRDTLLRYRYQSPYFKTYYSLKKVYNLFISGSQCQTQNQGPLQIVSPNEEDPEIDCASGSRCQEQNPLQIICTNEEDNKLVQSEYLPDSIREYIDILENKKSKTCEKGYVDNLREEVKKHLFLVGWTWCRKSVNTPRPRLIYRSPAGKFFPSIVTACKAYLEDQSIGTGTGTGTNSPVPVREKSKTREKSRSPSFIDESEKSLMKSLKRKQRVSVTPNESAKRIKIKIKKINNNPNDPLIKSLKRKQNSSVSPNESGKRIKMTDRVSNKPVDRTKEREKVANSKSSRKDITSPLTGTKTILSLLIDKEIVVPRTRVSYRQHGCSLKEGWITCTGIHCTCCNKNYSVSDFEIHAGRKTERPLENVYLRDGRSLLYCLVQVMERDRPGVALNARTKVDNENLGSDNLCSVCLEGGDVVYCDYCTSAYHPSCLGFGYLEGESDDEDWSCPSCSCMYCWSSEYNKEENVINDQTVLYCDQCENEYHVGCKNSKCGDIKCQPTGSSFCGRSCLKIWMTLDKKVMGKKVKTGREGYTWTLLKYAQSEEGQSAKVDAGTKAEQNAKLCLAAEVLNECFMPIIVSRSRSNLITDMIFNKESEIKRLNYRGFYTIVLEKGDEVVSTATLRVHGAKFAEMSLVGTSSQFRRQGLCRLLVSSVEQLLKYIRVETLILPAAPQMLQMWIGKFEFEEMNESEVNDILKYNVLKFPGSPMCKKNIY